MIIKRVVKLLRQHWPETHIILRGDGLFSNVELMQIAVDDPLVDFIFGLTGNQVLKRLATPLLEETRQIHEIRCHNTRIYNEPILESTKNYHELDYTADSWPQAFRTILNG